MISVVHQVEEGDHLFDGVVAQLRAGVKKDYPSSGDIGSALLQRINNPQIFLFDAALGSCFGMTFKTVFTAPILQRAKVELGKRPG